MKEFLVHRSGSLAKAEKLRLEALLKNRVDTFKELKLFVSIDPITETKVEHYYGLRCKLIHEVANAEVTEEDVESYRQTVERILATMFGLKF